MSFETFGTYDECNPSSQSQFEAPERIGGPIKANHLVTTKLGMSEATPILDRLHVVRQISLLSAEASLNSEAVVPAEYRIEIMDAKDPTLPAPAEYVQYVFHELKEARVPVQKPSRAENEGS